MAFVPLTVLFALALSTLEVQGAPEDCAGLKKNTFDLLLSVKETCDDGLKDCCQVRIKWTVSSINRVCNKTF